MTAPATTAAPADARTHAPWPLWKRVLAYAVLAAAASAAIWYVDLKAHRPPESLPPPSSQAAK
jgi:hypothetical protein